MKKEIFNAVDYTNTDPKGFLRQVDEYRKTPWGLYMARGADHPKFGYIEAWVFEDFRVTKFHFRSAEYWGGERYYIDIANKKAVAEDVWETRDYYIDILEYPDRKPEVLDLDEFEESYREGYISLKEVSDALRTTSDILEGIEKCGSFDAWLGTRGVQLEWKDPTEIVLIPAQ